MEGQKNIAIFASGSGTNAANIIRYFQKNTVASVRLVLSNKPEAKVLDRAKSLDVDTATFKRSTFYETDEVVQLLQQHDIDVIVLAGFLWLVPTHLIEAFYPNIVNIHPALLPKYGGKGMYGMNVHKAVLENEEKETGITIHRVNEKYDEGEVLFQAKCPVKPGDTPEDLAERVHQLEYEHYPKVIEKLVKGVL